MDFFRIEKSINITDILISIQYETYYTVWKVCVGFLTKCYLKLIEQENKEILNFVWPYLFHWSVISDNWAQSSLNQFKQVLSISNFWLY